MVWGLVAADLGWINCYNLTNMSTLFLSSAGVRFPIIERELLKILPKRADELKLVFIDTASKTEENINFLIEDRQKLVDMGFQISDFDLTSKSEAEVAAALVDADIIYVEGGNAYYLLEQVNRSGFAAVLEKLLERGVMYVGVSAGTFLACPTIEMADWHRNTENSFGLTDLSALNLVPFLITVHYNRPKYQNIQAGMQASQYPVRILTDDQAFLVRDGQVELVGEGEEVRIVEF